jgi:hypothetical protein
MSRKRREKKEKKAEMARQLGVKPGELDDKAKDLMAKGRVGHFRARPLSVKKKAGGGGVLSRLLGGKLHLGLAAFLVDGHGVRRVSFGQWDAPWPKGGAQATELDGAAKIEEDVRYERPAHFVVVLATAFGHAGPNFDALLQSEGLSFCEREDEQKTEFDLADKRFSSDRWEKPHAIWINAGGEKIDGACVSLSGVHKHKSHTPFGVESGRSKLEIAFDLRL